MCIGGSVCIRECVMDVSQGPLSGVDSLNTR